MDGDGKLTSLERRRIEADILAPVARALAAEVGEERAAGVLRRAIGEVARARGRELAAGHPTGDLTAIAALWRQLAEGGALDVEVLEESPRRLHLRVTRCAYADMYCAAGRAALGEILSCSRDEALLAGFSERYALRRTGHILAGDRACELLYTEVP